MPVTPERYARVLRANMDKDFYLALNPIDVGIVHGAIRLMLTHPEVASTYSPMFKQRAQELKEMLFECWRSMGFTEEEIQWLDTKYK